MAIVKRLSTDYDITVIDANLAITADKVTINGNLDVIGHTTQVGTVDTFVYDNVITLAAGYPGGPTLMAGIEVSRGSDPKVGIRWNESILSWEYTNNGTLWRSFSGTKLVEDSNPILGGNLVVNDYTITSLPGQDVRIIAGPGGDLVLGPVIRLPHINTDPLPKPGHSTIYAKATSGGSTGFYVSNDQAVGDELITKRKALVYSLIL